jgi:hypothetical protein
MNSCALDDFTTALIPLNETRTCDKCGAYTWWASPKQTKKGRCWDCAGLAMTDVTAEQFDRILDLFLKAFPGCSVGEYHAPVYLPDTYNGPDAGPCLRCRRRIRRYGMDAYLWCAECDRRRPCR